MSRPQGSTLVVNGRTLEDVTSAERVKIDLRPARTAAAVAPPDPPAPRFRVTPSPPGPDGRPRAPRREVEVEIDGWPDFRCWIWSSYPPHVLAELRSDDEARVRAAMASAFVSHNGWSTEDGTPYPAADDPAFWDVVPQELAVLLARAVLEAPTHYPNSLMDRLRR